MDTTLAYGFYDQNHKLLESFLELAHQQFITSYHCDIYHDAVAIANLRIGETCFVAFTSSGQGTFLQTYRPADYPANTLREHESEQRKICNVLSREASANVVYRFVAGADKYQTMLPYQWRQ
jgi:hypothetical protein